MSTTDDVQLRLISRESIQTLLGSKLKDLSWRTVKHIRTTLGTILGTAEVWGYIEDNRSVRLDPRDADLDPRSKC